MAGIYAQGMGGDGCRYQDLSLWYLWFGFAYASQWLGEFRKYFLSYYSFSLFFSFFCSRSYSSALPTTPAVLVMRSSAQPSASDPK